MKTNPVVLCETRHTLHLPIWETLIFGENKPTWKRKLVVYELFILSDRLHVLVLGQVYPR